MTANGPFSQFPMLSQVFQPPNPAQSRNMLADLLQRVFPRNGQAQTPTTPGQPPAQGGGPGSVFTNFENYLTHPSRETADAMLPPALVEMGHKLFPGQPATPAPSAVPQAAPQLPPPPATPAPAAQPPTQQFPWLSRLMSRRPTGGPGNYQGQGPGGPVGNGNMSF